MFITIACGDIFHSMSPFIWLLPIWWLYINIFICLLSIWILHIPLYIYIYIYPTICHYISPVKYRSNVLIWSGYCISPLKWLLSIWWLYKYIHILIIYMDITYPTWPYIYTYPTICHYISTCTVNINLMCSYGIVIIYICHCIWPFKSYYLSGQIIIIH